MLRHLLGTQSEDTIDALKAQLGVTMLEVIMLDDMEEYYSYMSVPVEPDPEVQVQ